MVPRDAVASRVTVWPTCTLLVSAEMVATTSADGSCAPVMTTSPVSTPPRLDVTRTSLGGTGTPVTFQINPPFAALWNRGDAGVTIKGQLRVRVTGLRRHDQPTVVVVVAGAGDVDAVAEPARVDVVDAVRAPSCWSPRGPPAAPRRRTRGRSSDRCC